MKSRSGTDSRTAAPHLDLLLRLPVEYLNEMRRDLPYAVRALVKSPGYAVVGIVSMGLGIGLTTNLYSTVWVLLTRPLAGVTDAEAGW